MVSSAFKILEGRPGMGRSFLVVWCVRGMLFRARGRGCFFACPTFCLTKMAKHIDKKSDKPDVGDFAEQIPEQGWRGLRLGH